MMQVFWKGNMEEDWERLSWRQRCGMGERGDLRTQQGKVSRAPPVLLEKHL